jgi:hypothetical protein
MSTCEQNVQECFMNQEIVHESKIIIICSFVKEVEITPLTWQSNLTQDVNMQQVAAKFVPNLYIN